MKSKELQKIKLEKDEQIADKLRVLSFERLSGSANQTDSEKVFLSQENKKLREVCQKLETELEDLRGELKLLSGTENQVKSENEKLRKVCKKQKIERSHDQCEFVGRSVTYRENKL